MAIPNSLQKLEVFEDMLDPHTQDLYDQIGFTNVRELKRYRGIDLEVFPRVFFPVDYSSKIDGITGADIRTYNGKSVLDVGSGTGIRAIVAGLSGAKNVTAIDIVDDAIENTRVNVSKYNLQDRIEVLRSDLFENVSGRFDVVIGYLPLVDQPVTERWELSIFDPGYSIHSRFFEGVRYHLEPEGIVKVVHSSKGDVDRFEGLIAKYDLNIKRKKSSRRFNLDWHFYDLNLSNNLENG